MRAKQFGQRTEGITREGLRNIQGVQFERSDDDGSEQGASKLCRTVFWIGAGAILIGIYVSTKGSGQDLSQYWKQNGGTVVDQVYVPIDGKDGFLDQTNKTCKSRGEAAGGSQAGKASAYVACLAAENPKRLCQASHRTHFIAAMRSYYRVLAQNRDVKVKTDPQVADALRAVIINGQIPRRDIMAAGAGDLETVLLGVEAKRSGC